MRERGSIFLRWVDRYLGIPLVRLCGIFKCKRTLGRQQKIAVLVTAGIGDTVLLTSILQDLKGKEITLFTGSANAEIGRMIPGVEAIALPITRPFRALKLIRRQHFDVWIDANPWPRINALFSYFARTSFTIGFKTAGQCRHWAYDAVVEHRKTRHEMNNLRSLLEPLGIKPRHQPALFVPRQKRTGDLIALHLYAGGSRALLKEWPEEHWLELIERLQAEGYRLILTGGPADAQRLHALRVRSSSPEKIALAAGRLNLCRTAELLGRVCALITVDTGVMHLAAALGCPLVALHGPTSPERWGAVGKRVVAVQQPSPYVPCIHLGFESRCKSNACMRAITPDRVLLALTQLLSVDAV